MNFVAKGIDNKNENTIRMSKYSNANSQFEAMLAKYSFIEINQIHTGDFVAKSFGFYFMR